MSKKLILFKPSIGSFNSGDKIIEYSAEREISELFLYYDSFDFATHIPNFELWQLNRRNSRYRIVKNADIKLALGSNLLSDNILRPSPNFNLNVFNKSVFCNTVLLGVGSTGARALHANGYSKRLYKKILSKDYIHSVRDEATKNFVESLGSEYKAINTGCPTMWCLTEEHCAEIPVKKADSCVFALTNNEPDVAVDSAFIDLLKSNYSRLYFAPQSLGDVDYFQSLNKKDIEVLPSDLKYLSEFYSANDIDYVGSRLHGGIYAMQHKKRTVILSVDERALEISKTYNINCVDRNDLKNIEELINSEFKTAVNIDVEAINKWKSQFINK